MNQSLNPKQPQITFDTKLKTAVIVTVIPKSVTSFDVARTCSFFIISNKLMYKIHKFRFKC